MMVLELINEPNCAVEVDCTQGAKASRVENHLPGPCSPPSKQQPFLDNIQRVIEKVAYPDAKTSHQDVKAWLLLDVL